MDKVRIATKTVNAPVVQRLGTLCALSTVSGLLGRWAKWGVVKASQWAGTHGYEPTVMLMMAGFEAYRHSDTFMPDMPTWSFSSEAPTFDDPNGVCFANPNPALIMPWTPFSLKPPDHLGVCHLHHTHGVHR